MSRKKIVAPVPMLVATSDDKRRAVFVYGSSVISVPSSPKAEILELDAIPSTDDPGWGPAEPAAIGPSSYPRAHAHAAESASDGITASAAKSLTYQVPKTVKSCIMRSVDRWRSSSSSSSSMHDEVPTAFRAVAERMVVGRPMDLPEVHRVRDCLLALQEDSMLAHKSGFSPGEQGYPSVERLTFDAIGGDECLTWSSKIVERAIIAAGAEERLEESQEKLSNAPGSKKFEVSPNAYDEDGNPIDLANVFSQEELAEMEDDAANAQFAYQDELSHNFVPSPDADEGRFCQICGFPRFTLNHIEASVSDEEASSESFDDLLDAQESPVEAEGDQEVGTVVAAAGGANSTLYKRFYSGPVAMSPTDEDEFWFEPDPVDRGISSLFYHDAETDDWSTWNPSGQEWVSSGIPDDVLPLDKASAYRAAVHMGIKGRSVPVSEIDRGEATLFEESGPLEWDKNSVPDDDMYYDDDTAQFILPRDGEEDIANSDIKLLVVSKYGGVWGWDTAHNDWVPLGESILPGEPITHKVAKMLFYVYFGTNLPKAEETFTMALGLCHHQGRVHVRGEEGVLAAGTYGPAARAVNASKQVRDSKGRFATANAKVSVGGRHGRIRKIDPATQSVVVEMDDGNEVLVPAVSVEVLPETGASAVSQSGAPGQKKATLPTLGVPLSPEDVNKTVDAYESLIEKVRAAQPTLADFGPDTSDVKPIFLAIVDSADNSAVLELVALAPASPTGSKAMAYLRTKEGWKADEPLLRSMRSTNPPPLVVLDDKTLPGVMEQVDSFYAEKNAEDEQQESKNEAIMASLDQILWTDDGVLLPVMAAGGLDRNRGKAERLRRYWTKGPGALKIRWGTPGDFSRCVRHLSKYMGIRSRGYCQLRHKEVLGYYTSTHAKMERDRKRFSTEVENLITVPGRIDGDRDDGTVLIALRALSIEEFQTSSRVDEDQELTVGDVFPVVSSGRTMMAEVLDSAEFIGWEGSEADLFMSDSAIPEVSYRGEYSLDDENIF